MDLLKWGLVPYWCKERPKPPPINAKAETVSKLPMFRAYRRRRCIVPVDGFFEWRAEHGAKQPYATAMQDRSPFGLAGLWENWKEPGSGEWVRTFCIITRMRTNSSGASITACRRSYDRRIMTAGSVTRSLRPTSWPPSQPSP